VTGAPQRIDRREAPPLAVPDLAELEAEHPEALATARQRARFLCGLTSPATTRAKLTKHEQFGTLADRRFGEVLAALG
jgi:ATP-dependent DNA helicase RecQ